MGWPIYCFPAIAYLGFRFQAGAPSKVVVESRCVLHILSIYCVCIYARTYQQQLQSQQLCGKVQVPWTHKLVVVLCVIVAGSKHRHVLNSNVGTWFLVFDHGYSCCGISVLMFDSSWPHTIVATSWLVS